MSLFNALNVAVSSINAINTAISTVSDNVSNSTNEDYNTRVTQFENQQFGGVRISDVSRKVNDEIFQDLLNSITTTQASDVRSEVYQRVEQLLGTSNSTTPLVDKLTALSTAWKAFEVAPESDAAEKDAIQAARNIVTELSRLSDGLDIIAQDLELNIVSVVTDLNAALVEVDRLNNIIVADQSKGLPISNLENLRDAQIDRVADIMQVRVLRNADGSVFLYTNTGLDLVGANATSFTFDQGTRALTKSGHPSTNLITDGNLAEGQLKALVDLARTDSAATTSADGALAPLQKLKNQLDEVAFTLMDESVARTTGTTFVGQETNFVTNFTGITGGETITIAAGGVAATTVTFGTGAGQVNNVTDLLAAINAITNVTGRIDSHGNLQILTTAEGVTIGGTALTALGMTAGATAADNPPTLQYAYNQQKSTGTVNISGNTNLVGLAGIATGDSFSVSVAGGAATTITFGAGAGQVNTTTALLAALNAVEGVRARLDANGQLEISTVDGQLAIANVTNTPLSPTGLGLANAGGNIGIIGAPQAGEQALDFFEVETGTTPGSATRVNIRVNDTLTNGTATLKDLSGSAVVAALNGTNRVLSGSGQTITNKDYSGIASSVIIDITKRSEGFTSLFKEGEAIRDNLRVKLRNDLGVDIDEEMAQLTVLQNSYAATAKLIETINNMFQALEGSIR